MKLWMIFFHALPIAFVTTTVVGQVGINHILPNQLTIFANLSYKDGTTKTHVISGFRGNHRTKALGDQVFDLGAGNANMFVLHSPLLGKKVFYFNSSIATEPQITKNLFGFGPRAIHFDYATNDFSSIGYPDQFRLNADASIYRLASILNQDEVAIDAQPVAIQPDGSFTLVLLTTHRLLILNPNPTTLAFDIQHAEKLPSFLNHPSELREGKSRMLVGERGIWLTLDFKTPSQPLLDERTGIFFFDYKNETFTTLLSSLQNDFFLIDVDPETSTLSYLYSLNPTASLMFATLDPQTRNTDQRGFFSEESRNKIFGEDYSLMHIFAVNARRSKSPSHFNRDLIPSGKTHQLLEKYLKEIQNTWKQAGRDVHRLAPRTLPLKAFATLINQTPLLRYDLDKLPEQTLKSMGLVYRGYALGFLKTAQLDAEINLEDFLKMLAKFSTSPKRTCESSW